MHIGLIGGIGPAATEHYYRGLIERHSRSGVPLELTIVHADVRELARNVAAQARRTQAQIFAGLVRRVARAGAQLAAVTSMGGHFCIGELEPLSPLPLLNAIPAVEAAIRARGLRTIGILGTKLVMETGLYGGISSARIVAPEGDALEQVHRSYIEMAQAGRVTEDQRQTFFRGGGMDASEAWCRGRPPRRNGPVPRLRGPELRISSDRLCGNPHGCHMPSGP
jgi:aspartate racemase